jgi:hypothetical protein
MPGALVTVPDRAGVNQLAFRADNSAATVETHDDPT